MNTLMFALKFSQLLEFLASNRFFQWTRLLINVLLNTLSTFVIVFFNLTICFGHFLHLCFLTCSTGLLNVMIWNYGAIRLFFCPQKHCQTERRSKSTQISNCLQSSEIPFPFSSVVPICWRSIGFKGTWQSPQILEFLLPAMRGITLSMIHLDDVTGSKTIRNQGIQSFHGELSQTMGQHEMLHKIGITIEFEPNLWNFHSLPWL